MSFCYKLLLFVSFSFVNLFFFSSLFIFLELF